MTPRRRDDVGVAVIGLGMAGGTILVIWVLVSGVLHTCDLIRQDDLDLAEQGPWHCGEVDVTTPAGNHAVEHQCWRAKNDAGGGR